MDIEKFMQREDVEEVRFYTKTDIGTVVLTGNTIYIIQKYLDFTSNSPGIYSKDSTVIELSKITSVSSKNSPNPKLNGILSKIKSVFYSYKTIQIKVADTTKEITLRKKDAEQLENLINNSL